MTYETPSQGPARIPSFYRADGYTGQVSVGYTMRQIVRLLGLEIDRRMEPHGLTNAQWLPLVKLHIHAGSCGVAELARSCQLDTGAMTRLLDRLESKGLCQRERSVSDRRVVHLNLTAEGAQAAAVIPEVLSDLQNAVLAGFSEAEWRQLCQFLQRILKNAEGLSSQAEAGTAKGL